MCFDMLIDSHGPFCQKKGESFFLEAGVRVGSRQSFSELTALSVLELTLETRLASASAGIKGVCHHVFELLIHVLPPSKCWGVQTCTGTPGPPRIHSNTKQPRLWLIIP